MLGSAVMGLRLASAKVGGILDLWGLTRHQEPVRGALYLSLWGWFSIGMGWEPGFLEDGLEVGALGSLGPGASGACLQVGALGDSVGLGQTRSLDSWKLVWSLGPWEPFWYSSWPGSWVHSSLVLARKLGSWVPAWGLGSQRLIENMGP